MPQGELSPALRQTIRTLSSHYLVPDIVLPESVVIFVLESPHVQELKYGAPVSGPSGATMSKHLFGESYARFPLGRLVKKNADEDKHRPRLDRIGLMNVSNIPLQGAAYGDPEVTQAHGDWLRAMGTLRAANQHDEYRDARVQTVQAVLAAHLRKKLLLLTDRACVFVPCGRFAQKFFRLADVHSQQWTVLDGVPHPSYNSWDRPQYQTAVSRVREALNRAAARDLTG